MRVNTTHNSFKRKQEVHPFRTRLLMIQYKFKFKNERKIKSTMNSYHTFILFFRRRVYHYSQGEWSPIFYKLGNLPIIREYSKCAVGTHPTGIYSCSYFNAPRMVKGTTHYCLSVKKKASYLNVDNLTKDGERDHALIMFCTIKEIMVCYNWVSIYSKESLYRLNCLLVN